MCIPHVEEMRNGRRRIDIAENVCRFPAPGKSVTWGWKARWKLLEAKIGLGGRRHAVTIT